MKILLALLTLIVAFVVVIAALAGAFLSQAVQEVTGGFSSVATAALQLEDHLIGSRANQYNVQDPFMQRVMGYWETYCRASDGSVCSLAASGNLQCVQFVTAAQWLGGDPITDHPDAATFWPDYAHKAGWQEIESPSAFPNAPKVPPNLGDLMVWEGGSGGLGHIAIVVGWTAPSSTQNGSIEVAEANGPGNKFPPLSLNPFKASDRAGNTYTMVVHPDYKIDTWGDYTDPLTHITYPAETVLGFIHHDRPPQVSVAQNGAYATTLPPGKSLSDPLVQEAWSDAESVGIPPGYYVRQINQESGFNPSAQSPAGAEGIAQFMPSTAAGIPNPLGPGMLNPWDPHQALLAAARYMAAAAQQYRGDYAKALAAYNGGSGEVTAAEEAAASAGNGSTWLDHLVPETRQYIQVIMGI